MTKNQSIKLPADQKYVSGWVNGKMGERMDVKAVLRIAVSNTKSWEK
jgi:hypothetical protein